MPRQMKDSGVAWIGNIPVNWSVQKVKNAFYRSKEEAHIEEPVVLSLARSGVKIRDISNNEGQLAESYYNYNPVGPGDLLLNPMDLYSGANCSVSKVEGVISPAYINLRTKGDYSPSYYDYYFKTQYWAMALFAHGKGVSFDNRWTLSPNDLLNYYIPVPSFEEQNRIAEFLDMQCAEIDAVIAKTSATIEEYKKLKQSIITDAVTKGIRVHRPMRDSGNECIGEMPADWKLVKMKYITKQIGDGIHTTPEYDSEGEYYFLNGNSIGKDSLVFKESTDRLNETEYQKYKQPLLNSNTIMITLNGATYGKTSFYNGEKVLLGKSAGFITLLPEINKRYIRYYLQSESAYKVMELSLCGTTIQNLSLNTLRNFPAPIPSDEEMVEISDYLDKKCAEMDTLIEKKTALLEEMEAYKKSVIYEYVTGKKEVL